MKNTAILFILFFSICSYCKSQSDLFGTFKYNRKEGPLFDESITLYRNGTFKYVLKMDMGVSFENTGNWQQRDSSLILDSSPQKEKIIVWESYERKLQKTKFKIISKDSGIPMYYHLVAILPNRDTLIFKDQYIETTIRERPISFWIINTAGLKSSEYKIKSIEANSFKALFENNRVFENEDWLIVDDNKIRPRGLDGDFHGYYLEKTYPSDINN